MNAQPELLEEVEVVEEELTAKAYSPIRSHISSRWDVIELDGWYRQGLLVALWMR